MRAALVRTQSWKYFASAFLRNKFNVYPLLIHNFPNIAKIRSFAHSLRWTTFIAFAWPFGTVYTKQLTEKLDEADNLFEKGMYTECKDCLDDLRTAEEPDNVEVLWRMSRALYNMANDVATDSKKKKEMVFEAFELINTAMALDPNHYAVHKWSAILLDLKSSYMGIKQRIGELEMVKQHMLVASELNPSDATTLYMLGEWCYQITDMPWYQRSIASTLFSTPPKSTYEEALEYFLKAEQAEPRFYSLNLLMLGKTYLKMGRQEQARYYLNLAYSYPAKTNDDHRANKEAKDLLRNLGSNKNVK